MDRNPLPSAAISPAAEPADPRPMSMSASPGINNGHSSDDALDQGVQGLTAEEEMREIHSLSAKEIASVQADLIGLSNSMSGLHISRSDSSARPVDQAQMMEIAKAMGSLPQSETEAYNKALQLCPDQVLDPCRMQMFLDYATEQEEPDGESKMGTYFRAVATQLAKYWKVREYIFNNISNGSGDYDDTKTMNAAYLPMTQAGALTPAGSMQLANRKVFQPLAQPDTSGRSVIFYCPARKNYAEHTFYDELSWLWYLVEIIMEDPNRRKHGVVIMVDLRGFSRKQTCKGAFFGLMDLMSALPISFKAIHACYPSAFVNHIFFPVMKRLTPKAIRLRSTLHYGTTNEVLLSLSGYCLRPDRVPTDLGGQLVVDTISWMANRLALETETPTNRGDGALLRSEQGVASPSLTVGEIQNKDEDHDDGSIASSPKEQRFANLTDAEVYEKYVVHKKRAQGQRGDPRMNQTLITCLRDPDLPHLDALLQNGFDFSPLSHEELWMASARDTKDADGVTLKQRLDNLGRRLRNAKRWIKEEREATDETKPSGIVSCHNPTISASHVGSDGSNDASGETSSDGDGKWKRRDLDEQGSGAAEAPSRRDSFDEVIDEVMAIEDLGQVIDEMISGEDLVETGLPI